MDLADNIRLPFPSVLQWSDIWLQVAEKDVASLETVLDHVDVVATNLTVIQKNLWDAVKRKALVFNRPLEERDATWQVLRELQVLLDQRVTHVLLSIFFLPEIHNISFSHSAPIFGWSIG